MSLPEPAEVPAQQNRPSFGRVSGPLLKRASTVSLFTALGVSAGFLVDVLLVTRLGIGARTDAYFGGYTVPLILIACISAVEPVLVTILVGYREDESAFSVLLNAATLAGLLVAGLGALSADLLVRSTTPGFGLETAALAALLARIFFARLPATAVAMVCRAELYARRRFGLAAFSNVLPSLATAIVLAVPRLGSAIEVVVASSVAGSLLQAAVLVSALLGPLRVRYRFTLRHPTTLLSQTGRLLAAPLVGLLLRQGVVIAERYFGSGLPTGSVTVLSYASRLTMTLAGIAFDGVTTAALPSLAERWTRRPDEDARRELAALFRVMVAVAIPAGLMAAALGTPLVILFFQRGQAGLDSARLMGSLFTVYALSLAALGPFRAAQTFFYAIGEVRAIVVLHGSLTALALLLDWVLVRQLGVMGLALSFVVSSAIMALVAVLWLARRAGDLGWRRLGDSFWRLGLASAAMAAVALALSRWTQAATQGSGKGGLVLSLVLSGVGGMLAFLGVGAASRAGPVSTLWRAMKEWVMRKASRDGPSGGPSGRGAGGA